VAQVVGAVSKGSETLRDLRPELLDPLGDPGDERRSEEE
jgi:hypothetical protein